MGIGMALLSATFFGLLTTIAKLSYDEGSNAITATAVRSAFAAVFGIILCASLRRDWRVPRSGWSATWWLAIGQTGMSICYLGSVQYLPVSLGAILFYTYPICVFVSEAAFSREIPGPIRIAAYITAFAGLVLALAPSLGGVDWRGLGFIVVAIVSAASMFFSARLARRHTNEMALMMWANLAGLPVIAVAMPLMGGFQPPHSSDGWLYLGLLSVAFAIAFISYTTCLKHIAPARAALFFNFEPLVTIVIAVILLGEVLLPIQMAGAAMVIGALMISAWRNQKKASP
jgi:drug/metabolite transporter (DMT)-like permease